MVLMGGVTQKQYATPMPANAGYQGFSSTPAATWGDYYKYQYDTAMKSGLTMAALGWQNLMNKPSATQLVNPVIGPGGVPLNGSTSISTFASAPAPSKVLSGGVQDYGGILAGTAPLTANIKVETPAPAAAPPILPNNTITNTSNMPVNVDYSPSATLVSNVDVPEFMNPNRSPSLLDQFPNATAQNMGETAWAPPSANRTVSDLDSLLSGKQYPIPQPQQVPMPQFQQQEPVMAPVAQREPAPFLEPASRDVPDDVAADFRRRIEEARQQGMTAAQAAFPPVPNYQRGPAIAGGVPMPEPAPQMPQGYYPPMPPQMPAYTPGQGQIDPRDYEAMRQAQMLYGSVYNPEYMDALQRQRLMQTYAYRQATQPVQAPQPIYAPGQMRPGVKGFLQTMAQRANMLNPNVARNNANIYNEYNQQANENYRSQLANQRQWAQTATQLTDAGLSQAGQNSRAFLNSLTDLIKAGYNQGGQITQGQLMETGMKLVENYKVGPERDQAIAAAAANGIDLSAFRNVPQSKKAEVLQDNRVTRGEQMRENLLHSNYMNPIKEERAREELQRLQQTMPAYVAAAQAKAEMQQLKTEIQRNYGVPQAQAALATKYAQLQKAQFGQLDKARNQANTTIQQIQNAERNIINAINPKDRERALQTYQSLGGAQGLQDAMQARSEVMKQEAELRNSIPQPAVRGPAIPGNIDLYHRPVVKNANGTISTVRSMSFNDGQHEVLIPTVSPDGRILSDKAAIDLYQKTGQHLGKFPDVESADAYAQQLHEQQDQYYSGRVQQSAPKSPATLKGGAAEERLVFKMGTSDDPPSPGDYHLRQQRDYIIDPRTGNRIGYDQMADKWINKSDTALSQNRTFVRKEDQPVQPGSFPLVTPKSFTQKAGPSDMQRWKTSNAKPMEVTKEIGDSVVAEVNRMMPSASPAVKTAKAKQILLSRGYKL